MRTKTLLAAAAFIAAGVVVSQAQQNVYSLNIVGYVNVTLKPGYNLVANQLNNSASATHEVAQILTGIAGLEDGSVAFGWNAAAQDFTQPANWVGTPPDGPAWYNADFTAPSDLTVPRGTSFFIQNIGATDAILTMVGEVPLGDSSGPVPANNGFLADFVPVAQEILANGFPVADGSTLAQFDNITQDYTQPLNGIATPPDGPAWYNADFTAVVPFAPPVSSGFLYNNPDAATTWNRNFTAP